ncbi:MAG TPA: valine--tRNA ligase [Solirubrobacteraceae bacterium]
MGALEDRTRFEPSEVEPRIVRRWLRSGLVHPEPAGTPRENYSIAVPPPNVTGVLHMGHALNGSIQDVLARSHRMRGRRTKWILGTDHAGIGTQRKVEERLIEEGTTRVDLGREAFVARVWEWRAEHGGQIIDQFKRIGATLDYADERFTMDERYAQAVLKVFVDLYEQGLIYRDNYLVNWDPGLRTAISDLEVEERDGIVDTLYSIAYPLASGDGEVVIATVRPETLLADTAVAVHPDDERYAGLVGQELVLPLVGRRLTIIADEYVKQEFGTGALKITPGHDPNDFEIANKHALERISVIGEDGLMTAQAGERYAGLTVMQARERVVADLEAQGFIRAREEYVHTVPFSQRSGERVEPLISLQWFMRMDELAAPAIEVVKAGRVRIHPESQSKRYLDWLGEIRPWCISRQLWWGHQIPVWYRGTETCCATTAPEGDGWTQDPDVLDTWFSSALWPFATLGWPEETPDLQAFYPTDVLSTARDILFLWVARMVMMGLRFAGDVPFCDVYVHSIIQAPDGRRMSKSLGTGIDPLDLIDGGPRPPVYGSSSRPPGDFPAYGADAVRFGLLAMSSTQDVRFSEEKIAQGQALANKLYNATRFVALRVGGDGDGDGAPREGRFRVGAPQPRTVEDRWILSRLQAIEADTQARIDGFDFAKAALGLYDFVYGDLCDWYLELVKPRLSDDADPGERAALGATLLHVLRETIATAHPIIPFVTEELWDLLGYADAEGLLAAASLPQSDDALRDPPAEAEMERAIEAIKALRAWRDSVGVTAGAIVPGVLRATGYDATAARVAGLARFSFAGGDGDTGADGDGDGAEPVATIAIPGGAVGVLASDAVDLGAADRRLEQARETLAREIDRAHGKLANEGFVAKAPAAVVAAERAKLERLRSELAALQQPAGR